MLSYPYPSHRHLVERLAAAPPAVIPRRWVLRDDNQQRCEGVLSLAESPVVLELHWKAHARGREQLVGIFRLDLQALLADGYIRRERDEAAPDAKEVRLRFHRGDRGVVSIQMRPDGPTLAIGTVDLTE